jgi:hypothetical protein
MFVIEEQYEWARPLSVRTSTEVLVIHHTAERGSTPQQIHDYHRSKGWSGIAYNYYVRQDGSVYRGRPEWAAGGHTLNYNHNSIGICFEGNFEEEEMNGGQLEAGQWLIGDILTRYPDLRLVGHRDLNATACPGRGFPMKEMTEQMSYEQFKEYMERYEAERAAQEPGAWSLKEREWADQQGIILGDESGQKRWASPLTREEYAVTEYRTAHK